ncbi:Tetrapyrrole (Corrin/Porphyrin) Methylases [Nitrosospira briensis]|uniref:Tetrapyrrole (Corrin/Porphyrin) Methylases n=1 Tax=Nitrosospira briensis TaxID=35799 RepID=A0A1I4Z4A7_9PROT|nr:SAM-dependent methyltransferase [Nitrosospira briensis]SFN44893.1 Tetrapyrrole (Corrin/Porphyrin) Methylases [Nitrosospira briensis]
MSKGSVTIVGTGIKAVSQITLEAARYIEQADLVLYLVADPLSAEWICQTNSNAASLQKHYKEGRPRLASYQAMVDEVMQAATSGAKVCVAFYGHPGIFVYPSHEIIRRAKEDGIAAQMLAGISADACLFADLGLDPARYGCASFEATDFLIHERIFDSRSALILWQVGVIGDLTFKGGGYNNSTNIAALITRLKLHYPLDHPVIIYEAAQYPICDPRIEHAQLDGLISHKLTAISTLYIRPTGRAVASRTVLKQLGMESRDGSPNI